MTGRQQSCAQRIRQELTGREESFAALWRQLDNPDAADDEADAVREELNPLSIEVRPVVTVLLSWGGPSDWLEIELESDDGRDIRRAVYHFADWFDHAERDVSEDATPALWRAADYFAECVRDTLQ